MLGRRGALFGLGAALAAPALVRTPGLLMPVKPVPAGLSMWVVNEHSYWRTYPDGSVLVWDANTEKLKPVKMSALWGTEA